jgi:iron complex outermembrane recepter protein
MTRSRMRKLKRLQTHRSRSALATAPLAAAIALASPGAFGQQSSEGVLEQVIVTAQKRSEDIQDVPLSIQALGSQSLEELRITDFDDYVRFLPTVSYTTFGPGFAQVYMRGVASGGDGNHSGSLPSVGVYLDEQPITTIQGALDVHLYDIARVEALAGPQGTLYGASSQAGTLRIITNKPDSSGFSAGYDVEGSSVADGDMGYLVQGHVNAPLAGSAAVRLVGWARHDAGYIDNVRGTRTFPVSGITDDNFDRAEDDYNDVDTYGARAALRIDLNESWSVTPALMLQRQEANGTFGFDPAVRDLGVRHMYPEKSEDQWTQAALTVEGRIANLDLVYAGSVLNRDVDTQSDYSDYSYWYDQPGLEYGAYIYDNDGDLINPSQYIQGKDQYKKTSHELRLSSPDDWRVRFVVGAFVQRQEHDIEQRYKIDDLVDFFEVTGWSDTLWLTQQERIDRDEALFGELSFDVTEALTLTGGLRYFKSENSLEGYFGFSDDFAGGSGEAQCSILAGDARGDTQSWVPYTAVGTAPCSNLDKRIDETDTIHKLNASYKFTDDHMMYVTWSRGYRPGGINRRGSLPPYLSDFLTNYELGWKTSWAGNRLRFNGAVFSQDWEDFQFSLLGANGLTEIKNANQARINGLEMDVSWALTGALTLNGGVAFLDSELTENYCGFTDANGRPVTDCPVGSVEAPDGPQSPEGTQLPVTPKFKGNLTARYEFPLGSFDAHVQGSVVHVGKRWADLRILERGIIGEMPSYTVGDISAGMGNGVYNVELFVDNVSDERAEIGRFAQCAEAVCGEQTYIVTNRPRSFGVRFGQKF